MSECDNRIAFVRVDAAARLCMDCNGIYDRSVHAACPACASQQSVGVQQLIGKVADVPRGARNRYQRDKLQEAGL